MDEVISLNVVFLNQFQRKLIHVPIGARYIWMLSFSNSFEFASLSRWGRTFLSNVWRLKVKLERSAFSKSFCQFWDRFRKMRSFWGWYSSLPEGVKNSEDHFTVSPEGVKNSEDHFTVSRWVPWPLDRGEAGSDVVFFFFYKYKSSCFHLQMSLFTGLFIWK